MSHIVITEGATLTVYDRTLRFEPGGGIYVLEGGKLITSGATFEACENLYDQKWRGIYAPFGQESAEVHLTNGTIIKNAETGLALGNQYVGNGLETESPSVSLSSTSFIDCNIGVHSFRTDELYQISYCTFTNNNIGVSLGEGVEGLDIIYSNFYDNDIGISSINSSVNVSYNNTFDGGRIGIFTGTTNPIVSNIMVGRPFSNTGNTFTNLEKGILAMGGGATMGLTILNNKFYDIQENSVQIRGESSFTIANNSFGDDILGGNKRGLEVMASGSNINRIECNIFTQNEVVDNVLSGVNNNTRFLENDYSTDAEFKNIAIIATLPDMGSAALSAANCFNDDAGISPDIASLNSNNFTYYYRNNTDCQEQEPNSLSNIIKENALQTREECDQIGPFNYIDPGSGNGGKVDINDFDADLVCKPCVLDSIEHYKNQIIANGGNNPETGNVTVETPTTGLLNKEQLFEQWVSFGLFVANEQKDYDFAEIILSPLNDWKWKTRYYELSLQKENFSEAYNRLAALPNTNGNQAAFKSTQEINLKYLTAKASGTENEITEEDLENLRDIGLSYEPPNGYARTLLFILTGDELPTLIPELEEYIEAETQAKKKEDSRVSNIPANEPVIIFPNPARDYIQISSESEAIIRIILTDIYGKSTIVKEGNYKSTIIRTTEINRGIYLVQLQLENGKMTTRKIIIEN